ncbi:hypothetical protein UPYG_G00353560 [Umbra pygmaea]|uniref:Btz domain-containing protein n=1 Tax=Umbra pygmaea TaxID=75934 RepID=A0ABD0VVF2_UMBPY
MKPDTRKCVCTPLGFLKMTNWNYNGLPDDQLFFQDEDRRNPYHNRRRSVSPLRNIQARFAHEQSRASNRYHDWEGSETLPRERLYREYGKNRHGFHPARYLPHRPGYNRMQSTAMGVNTFKGAGPMGHHRIYNPVDEQSGTDRRQLHRLGGRGANVSWKRSSTEASANTHHAGPRAQTIKRRGSDSTNARNSTPRKRTRVHKASDDKRTARTRSRTPRPRGSDSTNARNSTPRKRTRVHKASDDKRTARSVPGRQDQGVQTRPMHVILHPGKALGYTTPRTTNTQHASVLVHQH